MQETSQFSQHHYFTICVQIGILTTFPHEDPHFPISCRISYLIEEYNIRPNRIGYYNVGPESQCLFRQSDMDIGHIAVFRFFF